ncbi:Uncharacterised protein g2505 [Pycnogonum litorale]
MKQVLPPGGISCRCRCSPKHHVHVTLRWTTKEYSRNNELKIFIPADLSMVRNYIRKTDRQSWTEESMRNALKAVENEATTLGQAAIDYGIPKSTLWRRFKCKNRTANGTIQKLGGFVPVLPDALEKDLVNYVLHMETRMFGLTTNSIRSLAYQLCQRNNIPCPFDNAKEKAGKDWLYGFMVRHPSLTLRQPEATSAARARAFNSENVGKCFDLLESLMETYKFAPQNVFNVDETGITTVPGKPSKVICRLVSTLLKIQWREEIEPCVANPRWAFNAHYESRSD